MLHWNFTLALPRTCNDILLKSYKRLESVSSTLNLISPGPKTRFPTSGRLVSFYYWCATLELEILLLNAKWGTRKSNKKTWKQRRVLWAKSPFQGDCVQHWARNSKISYKLMKHKSKAERISILKPFPRDRSWERKFLPSPTSLRMFPASSSQHECWREFVSSVSR